MRKNEPTSIGDILSGLKKTTKLGKNLEEAEIWQNWKAIAGPHLSSHGRPQSIREGCLRVEVDSPVWMHRYGYKKWEIIKRINSNAKKELVHDLFLILLAEEKSIDDEEES